MKVMQARQPVAARRMTAVFGLGIAAFVGIVAGCAGKAAPSSPGGSGGAAIGDDAAAAGGGGGSLTDASANGGAGDAATASDGQSHADHNGDADHDADSATDAAIGDADAAATGAGGTPGTLAPSSLAVRFANAILARWPDPQNITPAMAWEYNHGIVLRGIEQVYRHTGDARYLAYIRRYADEFVSAAGVVNIPTDHSFDNIQPSVLLPFLYQQTGAAKYHTAADQIRARYDTIPRNADRGFWHKQIYPNQMWLDGAYMGLPFLVRYGATFGTCGVFCNDTSVEQSLLVASHVRDPATGLLYHAWDDSAAGAKTIWADPTTGRSPVVWGRAMGWYAMALVDMLPDLPANHAGRVQLIAILAGMAAALQTAQDPATGLWFQVVDQGARADDWTETSGSGMFVYALKVAVDRGYIDASYLAVANRGWLGLQTKVTADAAGTPTITGAVQGLGVQVDYAGYINQLPALSNSPHGLCAILLAASEMEAR
jgi:unsaturated rhamnogalacturonyl hydrolase